MITIIPDQQPSGAVMELNARCVAAAAVLGDYKAELAPAPVTRPPGREWMLRLADVLEGLLAALDDPAGGGGDEDGDLDGLEPYCAECGAWCGMFLGLVGWRHFRGEGTAASPVELFDAGHDAVVAWCQPPGRSVSPADAVTLRQALADAEAYRRDRAAACEDHVDDLDQAEAYAGLGRQLQQQTEA
jgi:hypothetical protein